MSLLKNLAISVRYGLHNLKHQRDGLFYENPAKFTVQKCVLLVLTPEVQLTLSYRIYNAIHVSGYWRTATLLYLVTKRRFSCDIAPTATIGPGLRLTHCSDIVVGPKVVIGKDVVIFNGTTLGNRLGTSSRGMPTLHDRVFVGTGAKVLGDIELHSNSKIGANAVVLQSVPPHASAVGVPARIIWANSIK